MHHRDVKLLMDGKGNWRDNVFIGRVWRHLKYAEVYLRAYESVNQACRYDGDYLIQCNQKHPHSILVDRIPDEVYFAALPAIKSTVQLLKRIQS